MIFHLKCGGAIRTVWGPVSSDTFACQVDGTTWTEKVDVWQDAAMAKSVPNDVTVADDVAVVKALPPVRDPKLPRKGTVIEKADPNPGGVGIGHDDEPVTP
jgi:hypothetical protein